VNSSVVIQTPEYKRLSSKIIFKPIGRLNECPLGRSLISHTERADRLDFTQFGARKSNRAVRVGYFGEFRVYLPLLVFV